MPKARVPERRCAGCGRRAPRDELLRFRVAERAHGPHVVPAEEAASAGRSAYLCRSSRCLHEAIRRRGFERAFRRPVHVDVEALEKIVREHERASERDGR